MEEGNLQADSVRLLTKEAIELAGGLRPRRAERADSASFFRLFPFG